MKHFKALLALVGLGLFAIILANANIAKIISTLFSLNLQTYSLALVILAFLLVLKALKWKIIISAMGKKITLLQSFRFYTIGLFIGNVTPGKIGDFSKAFYLKDSIGIPAGLASAILDRLIDVGILVTFSAGAALLFFLQYNLSVVPLPVLFAAIIGYFGFLFLLFNENYLKATARPFFEIIVPQSIKGRVKIGFSEVFSSIKSISSHKFLIALSLLVGLVCWFLSSIIFYILTLSLSMALPLQVVLMIFPIMSLAEILPISFSGVGTRDAILIFLLSFFSIGAEGAVALSLLVLFSGYMLVSFVGFIFFLLTPAKIEI
ncbi:MAG TPA: lysylphosphatidylglycerol synthase transmembrane domain-containing protein [archaeon]|nr:lysylphosphatidylglycerol synthase transmembrane domain-containing protein [archaeon]